MIQKLFYLILLPIFIWLLLGSYKEVKRDYRIENDSEFLFKIFWLLAVLYAAITFFMMAFFDASIAPVIKHW